MLPDLLSKRIDILTKLQNILKNPSDELEAVMHSAYQQNNWFTIDNIHNAIKTIVDNYLDENYLNQWVSQYPAFDKDIDNSKLTIGIVMAGNIPLVGFHDFLCVFICGFSMKIKLSTKDTILWKFIIEKIQKLGTNNQTIEIAEMLKGCDGYIATGSNNTSRYFESYFGKYPNIIRKNRTSVAILNGNENEIDLSNLYNDMTSYFGLGCRNVTKIYVPKNYNFDKLLEYFDNDESLTQHNKYKNNYDYYLAIYLLNKVKHLRSNNVLLLESEEYFTPVATINYEFYNPSNLTSLLNNLENDDNIQSIVINDNTSIDGKIVKMGESQKPKLNQFADGIDTISFLLNLSK